MTTCLPLHSVTSHRFTQVAQRAICLSVLVGSLGLSLSACAPLLIGGALVGGGMVAVDRRTSGAQLEDEGIELRANARLGDALHDRGHINVTSYNRQVLLTGEVASEQDKTTAYTLLGKVENVRSVINELAVMGNSTLTQRSSDSVVTARVKAALVDAKDLSASAFKVVTERGTSYLMGRVTQREATRATEVVRSVSGVQRVVRALDIISEQELQALQPSAPAK
jgi:osmotically-inducible protein OsmY